MTTLPTPADDDLSVSFGGGAGIRDFAIGCLVGASTGLAVAAATVIIALAGCHP